MFAADNPVRFIDAFVDPLALKAAGFARVEAKATGRPGYARGDLLKLYIYGYLNRIQSSRSLERETNRNIELMWLTGRLTPDFKTIADFRRDNGPAIRAACARFLVLCRQFNLFTCAVVAIDGSKFKAVNNRDKNFTVAKVAKRIEQVEASIERYLTGARSCGSPGQRCRRGQSRAPQGENRGPAQANAVAQGDGKAGGSGCSTNRFP